MGSKSPKEILRNAPLKAEDKLIERSRQRETNTASEQVKRIRSLTKLSQAQFAKVIDVELGTLQNWEQGRRNPTGPARALLRAIENDPIHVIAALID